MRCRDETPPESSRPGTDTDKARLVNERHFDVHFDREKKHGHFYASHLHGAINPSYRTAIAKRGRSPELHNPIVDRAADRLGGRELHRVGQRQAGR